MQWLKSGATTSACFWRPLFVGHTILRIQCKTIVNPSLFICCYNSFALNPQYERRDFLPPVPANVFSQVDMVCLEPLVFSSSSLFSSFVISFNHQNFNKSSNILLVVLLFNDTSFIKTGKKNPEGCPWSLTSEPLSPSLHWFESWLGQKLSFRKVF